MRPRSAALVLLAAFTLAGCSFPAVSSSTRTPSEAARSLNGSPAPSAGAPSDAASAPAPPAAVTFETLVPDGAITTAAICTVYRKILDAYADAAAGRLSSGQGKAGNPYTAADYQRTHEWVRDPFAKRFSVAITDAATDALNTVSDGQAGLVESVTPYRDASLDACGLADDYETARSQVTKAAALAGRIRDSANAKPWYPRGFNPYGPGLAIRWIDNAGVDCFSRCWYSTLEVVTDTGCPNGLYGEMNYDRGGTTVAWTNDSLGSLAPGRKGRLQFVSYDDAAYGAQGSLTKLDCY